MTPIVLNRSTIKPMRFISLIVLLCLFVRPLFAQEPEMASLEEAKEYEIGGVEVIGSSFSDANAIVLVSGLRLCYNH